MGISFGYMLVLMILVLVLVLVLVLLLALVLAFVLALVQALPSASIWHLAASELAASSSIRDHHLEASGSPWQRLGWQHLAASGTIWHHLGCLAERSEPGSPESRKNINFCETVNESVILVPKMIKN